jgi:integrase
MARRKLTKITVENTRPPKSGRLELWDTVLPGFGLRITDKDARSYFVMYRTGRGAVVHGKKIGNTERHRIIGGRRLRRLWIADAKVVDLNEAREKARGVIGRADAGEDPAAAGDQKSTVFRDFVAAYLAHGKPDWRPRVYEGKKRFLETQLVPRWGDLALSDIKRRHVDEFIDDVIERGARVGANRNLSEISALLNHAVERGVISASPIANMKKRTKERSRERALTDQELRWFWEACDDFGWPFGPLFRLLALTGQRRDQVRTMAWAEIDKDNVWTIASEKMKGGRGHEVALSDLAVEILRDVKATALKVRALKRATLVFTTDGKTPVSGFSKAKARLDEGMERRARGMPAKPKDAKAISRWRQQLKKGPRLVQPWTLHDLRRTMVHGLAKLGFPPHVADKILAHSTGAVSGVAAIYNKYEYANERRDALAAWGAVIAAFASRGENNETLSAN